MPGEPGEGQSPWSTPPVIIGPSDDVDGLQGEAQLRDLQAVVVVGPVVLLEEADVPQAEPLPGTALMISHVPRPTSR